jgi:hypothetical protein
MPKTRDAEFTVLFHDVAGYWPWRTTARTLSVHRVAHEEGISSRRGASGRHNADCHHLVEARQERFP